MKEIVCKNKCSGCTACYNVCPKKAIFMEKAKDGFRYPKINNDLCIDCGLCKRICPVVNTKKNISLNECFVGYCKNDDHKRNASSGGVFSLLATKILEKNGIIVGAELIGDKLQHTLISSKNELEKLKGSKYLQSDLNDVFSVIKKNVEDKKILFVGTPCQVAGLKLFLRRDYDNLLCVDLFCHGVPSPNLFSKYIKELEKDYNERIINYNFRDKCTGWDTYSNTIFFQDKSISELYENNNYMKLFLNDVALRESCYNCNFKLGNKYSDITIGDFWGVKKYYPDMYSKDGVSAIIINTKKGYEFFSDINQDMKYKECKLSEILDGNPSLKKSALLTKKRKMFFDELDKSTIESLTKKYGNKSFIQRIKNRIKREICRLKSK